MTHRLLEKQCDSRGLRPLITGGADVNPPIFMWKLDKATADLVMRRKLEIKFKLNSIKLLNKDADVTHLLYDTLTVIIK